MPNNELVVSDTSPLLNLALIDQLTLLKSQFSSIIIPRQVWNELTDGEAGVDALRSLHDDAFLSITEVKQSPSSLKSSTSWILAKQSRHCAGADLILLDEKDGRQVARRHDLTVTGVIGILLRGANAGNIELKHELDALRDAGFWISDDLYSKVLAEATK